jgi:hypothetical protein
VDNIALYKAGRDSAYQAVALQLRNLLLGGRRALLLRVLPTATFHAFVDDEAPGPTEQGVNEVVVFGHAEYRPPWRGQRGAIGLEVDPAKEPLAVSAWLRQQILEPGITVEGLVRSTTNEEVAHTQEERGALLASLADAGVLAISKADLEAGRLDQARMAQQMHEMAIVGIGEYVVQRVRALLANE